jgi:hypothetical protein
MIPKNRVEDVIYFDPGDLSHPIGMNMFEIDPNDPDRDHTKDFIIDEVVGMLYSLYDPGHTGIVGPRMENIVRNAAHVLMDSPEGGTFMDIPAVITDPEFTKARIPYLKNPDAIRFWTKEWPAAQRSNDAGEVSSWVVSKWAQFQTTMMRNILGQTHSELDLREIMDNKKILLVNLSKGKLGEIPAKVLGMIFVMKFQAAAMSRANMPEEQREDFCLFVDEFQNFATDSFESILSEARKFRLNLIVANQFMSQLTDKIKSAIIGNVGSMIVGRMGFEDAEQMVKQFSPTFDVEDLQRMPNRMGIAKVLIDGYPSQPFTMSFPPPMGNPNPQLADAVKRLSAAKYGRPRTEVEAEINARLNSGALAAEKEKKERLEQLKAVSLDGRSTVAQPLMTNATPSVAASATPQGGVSGGNSSFLDSWLKKRDQMKSAHPTPPAVPTANTANNVNNAPKNTLSEPVNNVKTTTITDSGQPQNAPVQAAPAAQHIARGEGKVESEVHQIATPNQPRPTGTTTASTPATTVKPTPLAKVADPSAHHGEVKIAH